MAICFIFLKCLPYLSNRFLLVFIVLQYIYSITVYILYVFIHLLPEVQHSFLLPNTLSLFLLCCDESCILLLLVLFAHNSDMLCYLNTYTYRSVLVFQIAISGRGEERLYSKNVRYETVRQICPRLSKYSSRSDLVLAKSEHLDRTMSQHISGSGFAGRPLASQPSQV